MWHHNLMKRVTLILQSRCFIPVCHHVCVLWLRWKKTASSKRTFIQETLQLDRTCHSPTEAWSWGDSTISIRTMNGTQDRDTGICYAILSKTINEKTQVTGDRTKPFDHTVDFSSCRVHQQKNVCTGTCACQMHADVDLSETAWPDHGIVEATLAIMINAQQFQKHIQPSNLLQVKQDCTQCSMFAQVVLSAVHRAITDLKITRH